MGTAIIDAYLDRAVVLEIPHEHPRAEGEGGVGGGELVHVVGLTARRATAMMGFAVPGGRACLDRVRHGLWGRRGNAAARRGTAGQRHHHRERRDPRKRGPGSAPPHRWLLL